MMGVAATEANVLNGLNDLNLLNEFYSIVTATRKP